MKRKRKGMGLGLYQSKMKKSKLDNTRNSKREMNVNNPEGSNTSNRNEEYAMDDINNANDSESTIAYDDESDIVDVLHDDDVSTVGYEEKEDMNEILILYYFGTNDVKQNY